MENVAMQPNIVPALNKGLSKHQISALVQQSVETVLEENNAAQVAEVLAVMEAFVKGIRSDARFVDLLRDELLKNKGNVKMASGTRIQACEAGTVYDYSDNPAWNHLENELAQLTAEKKSLEEKLRQIPTGKMIVDEETGEVFTGALKSSKSTYRITLAR